MGRLPYPAPNICSVFPFRFYLSLRLYSQICQKGLVTLYQESYRGGVTGAERRDGPQRVLSRTSSSHELTWWSGDLYLQDSPPSIRFRPRSFQRRNLRSR